MNVVVNGKYEIWNTEPPSSRTGETILIMPVL